jgi:hypothetical protein
VEGALDLVTIADLAKRKRRSSMRTHIGKARKKTARSPVEYKLFSKARHADRLYADFV